MSAIETTSERPILRRGLVGPLILIGLGLVFLANNMGWLGWEIWTVLWPLVLIAIGAALIWRRTKGAQS